MVSNQNTKYIQIGFYFLLVLGVLLRILKFGTIPFGLNGDEASIGYEAFSLLNTGKDRWGLTLPPYFMAFGSGQNTLYAYLSVPFLYFFDLSQTSIRMLSAFMGLLTIPVVYALAKLIFKNTYFVVGCTILFLFDPYQFMISRWALEINILPFFVLSTLFLFTKTFSFIQPKESLSVSQKVILLASFPSMAFIIYTYASAIFVVPFFLLFLLIYYRSQIKAQITLFALSFGLFILFLSPFILFIIKNNLLKSNLPFEEYLPFQIPKMLSAREEIFKGLGGNLAIIKKNIIFIFSGFKETDRIFNTTRFYNPHLFLFFAGLGFVYLFYYSKKRLNPQYAVLLFWGIASLIPFLFFEMNLNRSVYLQAVIPLFTAVGLFAIFDNVGETNYKKYFSYGLICLFMLQSTIFYGEYFLKFPKYDQFTKNFDLAVKAAESNKKPDEKIAVTAYLMFNYLYVGFYQKYPPALFHKSVKADFSHQNVSVHSFDGYYILGDFSNAGYYLNLDVFEKVKKESSFIAILKANEKIGNYEVDKKSIIDTTLYHKQIIRDDDDWDIIRFTKIKPN